MRKNYWKISVMIVILIAIVSYQVYWILYAYKINKSQFSQEINSVMENYSATCQNNEMYSTLLATMREDSSAELRHLLLAAYRKNNNVLPHVAYDSLTVSLSQSRSLEQTIEKLVKKTLLPSREKNDSAAAYMAMQQHYNGLRHYLASSGIDADFELAANDVRSQKLLTFPGKFSRQFMHMPIRSRFVMLGYNPRTYAIGFCSKSFNAFTFNRLWPVIASYLLLIIFAVIFFIRLMRSHMTDQNLLMLKTDFVNNMAHELKTPVSTAQITLDALDKYSFIDDKVKSRQYLSIINRELSRLSLLIDNLINKTIVDDDFEVYEYSVIDIVALSRHVVQSFTPVFEQFNVRFNDSYNPGKICISGDRNHLANVLYNIMDNAVKYRTARPEITFGVERKEKAVQITLQDNGIGIADRENEKVFEKFFRGTNKNDKDKGHGLGLYYVKQVIVQHQGAIRFVKTDQNLTTLLIELPLYYAGDC